jgi:hypothetical protein
MKNIGRNSIFLLFCCFVVLWGLLVNRIIKRFYIIKISFDFYGYFFESE